MQYVKSDRWHLYIFQYVLVMQIPYQTDISIDLKTFFFAERKEWCGLIQMKWHPLMDVVMHNRKLNYEFGER